MSPIDTLSVWIVIAALLAASWSWRIEARREVRRQTNAARARTPAARSTDGSNRPATSNDTGNVWD